MLKSYFRQYVDGYKPYKGGPVCYEDGCLYRGLISLNETSGEAHWFTELERIAGAQVQPDGVLFGYKQDEYNIDNILSGRAFLSLYEQTGDNRYLKACEKLAEQLKHHPRTRGGNYWHKERYPYQVWLDGLYMALPFQVEFAQLTQNDALAKDAILQMTSALALMSVSQNGLYAHGYDETRSQRWANPKTGLSQAHWARSLGWVSMALVELCEMVERSQPGSLYLRTIDLLDQLLRLQQQDGSWLQVIDQPHLEGNYSESSATAMFAYSLLKAGRLGYGPHFAAAGSKALNCLEIMITESSGDRMTLPNVCCVAGLGGFDGNYRDGSTSYYLSEKVVADDIKAVGPLMMAFGEKTKLDNLLSRNE